MAYNERIATSSKGEKIIDINNRNKKKKKSIHKCLRKLLKLILYFFGTVVLLLQRKNCFFLNTRDRRFDDYTVIFFGVIIPIQRML